jgi:hypothetical protein
VCTFDEKNGGDKSHATVPLTTFSKKFIPKKIEDENTLLGPIGAVGLDINNESSAAAAG